MKQQFAMCAFLTILECTFIPKGSVFLEKKILSSFRLSPRLPVFKGQFECRRTHQVQGFYSVKVIKLFLITLILSGMNLIYTVAFSTDF